jgi:hypothetical protein
MAVLLGSLPPGKCSSSLRISLIGRPAGHCRRSTSLRLPSGLFRSDMPIALAQRAYGAFRR